VRKKHAQTQTKTTIHQVDSSLSQGETKIMNEQTLIVIKPDGVKRGLIGEIIKRFETAGLRISKLHMRTLDEPFTREHYFLEETWAKNVYEKTKNKHEEHNKNPFPFNDHLAYGKMIQDWNVNFLIEGPVIAMIAQGPHAIQIARKIIGVTEPLSAAPGTIRGDYAMTESYAIANSKERTVRNLVHASDSQESAKREIHLWFGKQVITHG
jgi:nucleoside-diphosphate kinase